ncbi:MAG: GDP-L-fucose synthase [Candidatus Omnitrophica bacterium]|nr:GDP-L-fucose synthase [Candidatus Omnitrophota bacterium]MCB9720595.1 GDP-L-fucose synthase [Candidatus Omnitrophota bacterium]
MTVKGAKILVVGHGDILECAVTAHLREEGAAEVYSVWELALDCAVQPAVHDFFQKHRPDYVVLGSTRSGGIQANLDHPADFSYHNVQSAANVFHAAYKFQAKKVLFWASSCIYPREAPQPYRPDQILTGPVESSSEPYAIAKLAGLAMARGYRRQHGLSTVVAIPATVYGPGSDGDLQNAHVIGALIHKFQEAMHNGADAVEVWGSGNPLREFLYRDDLCAACRLLLEDYDGEDIVNVGSGEEVSIADLARMVAEATDYRGQINFDASRPDGAARKVLDSQPMRSLGWQPETSLKEGIRRTVNWFQQGEKV